MRRILFFADASSVHTQRWVHEMATRGFDCMVATRRPADVPGASDVVPIRPGGDAAGWWLALGQVRRVARRLSPQWLHGHYVTSYGLWAGSAGRALGRPVVLSAWGSDILVTPREPGWRGRAMAWLVGRTLRRADLVTADAADVLDEIRRYGATRCEEVLWGADTERFVPGEPAPGFEIASLRAWEPNYNIDTLLRAFAALRAERPEAPAVLHLLGGGPGESALRAEAAALAIEGDVRFTGRVDDAAMVTTLQRCRVSVSVPSSDATSVSVLESMSCGLPVVASDLPANRRWIEPALLVPPRDAGALAAALSRLAGDAQRARSLGQRNRALVLEHASRRAQMDRMASLYDDVLVRHRRP